MADKPTHASSSEEGRDRGSPPGTPRWVKVSAVVAVALMVLVAVMLLVGGPGGHGPGRHLGGEDGPAGDAPRRDTPGDAGGRHKPPPGVDHGAEQP